MRSPVALRVNHRAGRWLDTSPTTTVCDAERLAWFKYASTRKGPRELRVREAQGNPCLGIPPPRDGASKRRHWLRPDQFVKLIACEDVPRGWREAYAVCLYLHCTF